MEQKTCLELPANLIVERVAEFQRLSCVDPLRELIRWPRDQIRIRQGVPDDQRGFDDWLISKGKPTG